MIPMHIYYVHVAVNLQIYSPSLSGKLGILFPIKNYPLPQITYSLEEAFAFAVSFFIYFISFHLR